MQPQSDDQQTPLIGNDQPPLSAMQQLRIANELRRQRQSLKVEQQPVEQKETSPLLQAASTVMQQNDQQNAQHTNKAEAGERQQIYDIPQPATVNAAAASYQPQINGEGVYTPAINNYDDYYHRADSSPITGVQPPAQREISPFDHNPNPGSTLPEWRQFGFESEQEYRESMQAAQAQERLQAFREGRQQPQEEQNVMPSWIDRFYNGSDEPQNNNEGGAAQRAGGDPEVAAGQGVGDDIDGPPQQNGPGRQNNNEEPIRITASDKFKKLNRYEMTKLTCFAALCVVNSIALPEANTGCEFESTKYNMAFLYIVIITEFVLRVLFQFLLLTNEEQAMFFRNQILKVITGFLYAAWSIYVIRNFESFTPHCYDPYPSFSLAVFAVIVCFILPLAFLTMFMTLLLVLFSPCIMFSFVTMMRERNALEQIRQGVIDNMPKVKWDKRRFWGITNCVVCIVDFAEEDVVTPLRCDMRHTFHSDCITHWFQTNNVCPVCRTHINPDDMSAQSRDIESILDKRGRLYDEKMQREATAATI